MLVWQNEGERCKGLLSCACAFVQLLMLSFCAFTADLIVESFFNMYIDWMVEIFSCGKILSNVLVPGNFPRVENMFYLCVKIDEKSL